MELLARDLNIAYSCLVKAAKGVEDDDETPAAQALKMLTKQYGSGPKTLREWLEKVVYKEVG